MKLEVKNVDYTYNKNTAVEKSALKDISFTIKENEFIGLIGHTGSGKSTLIQNLNALLSPTTGQIIFNDEDINDKKFNRRLFRGKVGLVFQYPEYQLFETTVLKDVCFGAKNIGMSEEEAIKKSTEILLKLGIKEEDLNSSPFELSGGQKRRVAIAGVLVMNPEILILDEPTAGLDPIGREEILKNIYEIHKKNKNTTILVSHSMDEIATYVNRLLVINDGQIYFDNVPKNVFKKVDELEKIGLSAPQISYLIKKIKRIGIKFKRRNNNDRRSKRSIIRDIER